MPIHRDYREPAAGGYSITELKSSAGLFPERINAATISTTFVCSQRHDRTTREFPERNVDAGEEYSLCLTYARNNLYPAVS